MLHGDGIPGGAFGDWRTGITETWRADIGRRLTPDEEAAYRARVEAIRREREAEEARRYQEAREKAAAIWKSAEPATENHPYLAQKGIKPHGVRVHNDALVVPMRDATGELHNLQFVEPDGDKRFLTGGRVKGCYFGIDKPDGALCIAEGYATGASIHESTGQAVAVAFTAGNLLNVARALRQKFPDIRLILCADNDMKDGGQNPGLTKATEAARAVGGLVAVPDFGADRPEGATDFNDLHQTCGAEAVERAVANAQAPVKVETSTGTADAPAGECDDWPEPLPLVVTLKPEPYPLDALPDMIRAAVEEVKDFTKAPVSLVASSTLGALSLAIQALYDVKRTDGLTGPVSLFLLTIADSGERKSTCDGYFTAAIRKYEKDKAKAMQGDVAAHQADTDAWDAKRAAILNEIKKGGGTADRERNLRELEKAKPKAPRVPKLLRMDETPENFAYLLAHEWPSVGIVSAEGGLVFGAHGMGNDSMMRNLTLHNVLWDGGTLAVGRRHSESYTVRGARLTVALQVQEPTLREFFERSCGLARGTGFLARFLVAWPESTQGYRAFTEAPPSWPALAAFNRRITDILNAAVSLDDDGALTPGMLFLSPDAKAAWVAFHDAIEGELRTGGELYDVRDVASKAADNAARLAALFHAVEHGAGAIRLESFEPASRVVAWHLNESRRFFGELALPAELANAGRLDAWLIDYCRRERTHMVPTRTVQQFGSHGLRQRDVIEAAMRELEELGRARLTRDGRRKEIRVNPELLGLGVS